MAVDTLTSIPAVFEAGSTLRFTQNLPQFPIADWTAKLLIGFDTPWLATATTSGSNYLFEVSALNSATFPAGTYPWYIYVFDEDAERTAADSGTIRILPNGAAVREPSKAELALVELDASLLALAGSADLTVSFNGQSFTKADHTQLFGMRVRLQAEVIREKEERLALAGGADSRAINIRFSNGQASPFLP